MGPQALRRAGYLLVAATFFVVPAASSAQMASMPLEIGETFTVHSRVLGETRRINVYRPPYVADSVPLPVLYMPDGGIGEDFLHIAGLVQVSTGNGTMKPVLLVGIENTERRRDLTGPTDEPSDREIAPVVGGSPQFREFIRSELMPAIRGRYATTPETAIVGESLAGLFVLETLVLEPDLFDIYIAIDPSLWWNGGALSELAQPSLKAARNRVVFLASSSQPEIADMTNRFAEILSNADGIESYYEHLSEETHATIYHPAALKAFRKVLEALR